MFVQLVDSYAGFRSDFIHYSISLKAPMDDDTRDSRPAAKNSLHFSPMLMAHFWRWWELFDSAMSLPVRQGRLFPTAQEPSKKFGRHVATIKYRFDFNPIFLCHTYRQEDWQEWSKGVTSVLGLKGRIDMLEIDLHQRIEEFHLRRPEFREPKTVFHKKFYLAQVHCTQVDLRAMVATFKDSEKADVPIEEESVSDAHVAEDTPASMSHSQLAWVDYEDFVDLGPRLKDPIPSVQIFEVMTCPVITYYRQPTEETVEGLQGTGDDHEQVADLAQRAQQADKQSVKRSKFGWEGSHSCLVSGEEFGKLLTPCALELLTRLRTPGYTKTHCIGSVEGLGRLTSSDRPGRAFAVEGQPPVSRRLD
jgi:hypothetical protein